ncbi:hypothetical protein G5V58_13795 [Nocardioides anomalus]|uniref:Uncharacterized protein n=1 Tax=Nocardioides anomalus TaxID=2712223 RepID=A0A6G6WF70_9ACTN|nr:hypothetical protein [Nocardioides anomalus]QIG43690.1 hypothetical protein G5V58_13795 [Nocardioides anomalus]
MTTTDTRLAAGVAAACLLGLVAFVLPLGAGWDHLPSVWLVAADAVVLLGPVAAGLAGCASLGALRRPETVRPAAVTLTLVAAYAVGLGAVWATGGLAWFAD